ncbi:MAG: hypothetical protein RIR70_1164 [Pseudomonadota bacterium]
MLPSSLPPNAHAFAGLDLLACAVVLIDAERRIIHVNPAAENLFAIGQRHILQRDVSVLLGDSEDLAQALARAAKELWSYTGFTLTLPRGEGEDSLHLECTITPIEAGQARLLMECRLLDQQLRASREEALLQQQEINQELLRNLAHEIKNPLGGIRGSAQLLERELEQPALREYTQVIIHEVDRLQALIQRILSPHRRMQPAPVCIHEILEHVLRLVRAEFPGVKLRRDYDTSLPDLTGDREQLIQTVLNIARNAAQAMKGHGDVVLRTRPARQVTLAKRRYRLALELQIIDNGPGIPEHLQEKIFYPLVSGREAGTGLGLTIAQSFIAQHHGTIDVKSRPGTTCFTVLLPLSDEYKGTPL